MTGRAEQEAGPMQAPEYCKLEIFVPESHLPPLREALREAGAGHIGNYDSCLSYSRVTGCWRPLPGSSPYLGEENTLQTAPELKVEVLCPRARLEAVLAAVRLAHPYEVPVINVIALLATGLEAP
ncbi:GTP cyclohydrolase 1 type 2 [bioreactor metagenome]|uniref:GTP cyclohydrolase 1 type 2 n=1 Tax=bioreactor metagenome TaxID=1076179 RepID=A0A645EWB4_9ZZZZ